MLVLMLRRVTISSECRCPTLTTWLHTLKGSITFVHSRRRIDFFSSDRQAIEIVYVTKTVMWEDPAIATVFEASSSSSSSTTSTSQKPIQTPVYIDQVVKGSSPAAVYSAAPVILASSSTSSTKAAATSSGSSTSTGSSGSIVESSVNIVESAVKSLLALGVCSVGTNSASNTGGAWIGKDGDYTMQMVNAASEDLTIVVWGNIGSWVNVKVPAITISLAQGAKKTVSFANGFSGAFSAIYSDTKLVNGQISNTWGECTFNEAGVCDVSREVNMSGHNLEIVGPNCTSNMSKCVFVCDSGNTCMVSCLSKFPFMNSKLTCVTIDWLLTS